MEFVNPSSFSSQCGLSTLAADRTKLIHVDSPGVTYTDEDIVAKYQYSHNVTSIVDNVLHVKPSAINLTFKTKRGVSKTGVMFVGWAGNNGSTTTAGLLAHKHNVHWETKTGMRKPDFFGSLTQSSTIRIGATDAALGPQVDYHVPFFSVVPMVDPTQLVVGGWDINGANMADAMRRACVLDVSLQQKLAPYMADLRPLPSMYYPDFIAANQEERADNVLKGTRKEHLAKIRQDIKDFKAKHKLDQVIVLWTANTERFTDIRPGLNMTADEVLHSIDIDDEEISPSQIFAVASILEGTPYINGSPQNTFVPGIEDLAERHRVYIGGDDFKSGQTKLKSVLVDFLISAGIKVESIASYNHLGNNDGKNLQAPMTFRSKEISKSNVVDDMVSANKILYEEGEHPDHVVVIKYIPHVGDSKRAMDEYTSSIFLGGTNTLVIHNTCEDSLLAAPLMIDLVLLTELMTRITYQVEGSTEWQSFRSVLSILSYMLKAPMVPRGTPVINALMKQQRAITNLLCALVGLPVDGDMMLEHRLRL
jgi:myo-inositol-1-phosphate synthase